jgi:hypothetical protein
MFTSQRCPISLVLGQPGGALLYEYAEKQRSVTWLSQKATRIVTRSRLNLWAYSQNHLRKCIERFFVPSSSVWRCLDRVLCEDPFSLDLWVV